VRDSYNTSFADLSKTKRSLKKKHQNFILDFSGSQSQSQIQQASPSKKPLSGSKPNKNSHSSKKNKAKLERKKIAIKDLSLSSVMNTTAFSSN
jgi:hypothetical protein